MGVDAVRGFVWLNAILFIVFGLGFMLAPAFFAARFTDAVPATVSAAIDMRATYGGLAAGIGLWLAYCARSAPAVGLIGVILLTVPVVFARALGFALDGAPNGFIWTFFALESLFLAAALWLRAVATGARH